MALFQSAVRPHARDVKALTSLRFFAAAWVLALHYTDFVIYGPAEATGFFDQGKLGVDFFFILSGFILTHVYFDSLQAGRFSFLRFVQKRLARLYPVHLVTFFLVVGYVAAGQLMGVGFKSPEVYTFQAVWPNLALLHAWGVLDQMSWNYVSWSISAEWFAYLLFLPLSVGMMALRGGPLVKLGVAVALFGALYLLSPALIGRPLTYLTHDFGILRILPEFILGMALYHVSRQWDLTPKLGAAALASAVVAIILMAHWNGSPFFMVLLLGFVIFAAASLERQGGVRLLANRALIYFGETSYSLYMVHAIVFIVYFKGLQLLLGDAYQSWIYYLGPLAIPLALAAASMGYHLVEIPARRFLTERLDLAQLVSRFMHPLATLVKGRA